MTDMRAAMPPRGAAEDVTTDLFSVTLRLEDSPHYQFDLTRLAGPSAMRIEVGAAVLAWTSEAKGIRRKATLQSVRGSVSAWMRWVREWNDDHDNAPLDEIKDVSAFHIVRYRAYLNENYTTATVHNYLVDLRGILRRAVGAQAPTLRATNGAVLRGTAVSVQRYTPEEFSAIRNAARRIVEKAHERIHSAHMNALTELGPVELRTSRGRALYELLTVGAPQSAEGYEALSTVHLRTGQPYILSTRRLLFLDPEEAFAAGVLVACHRGINLSSVVNAANPVSHGEDFWQLDMDKPRRGTKRFWPEFIDGVSDPKSARALRLVVEATEPARILLDKMGSPTNTLLLRWSVGRIKAGVPRSKTRSSAAWLPHGENIDFSRLRRSVPGRGVVKEPSDHDPATYLHYVKSDPLALQERQVLAAAGIRKAMDLAREKVHVALRDDQDLVASNDALIVNCTDPGHNPVTQSPCTTALYSFLDCLDCSNAATVARLIPRQLAAVSVLEQLRDAMGETWEKRFARRYYQLKAILERHTPIELDIAASSMAQYVPAILSALRHEVPR